VFDVFSRVEEMIEATLALTLLIPGARISEGAVVSPQHLELRLADWRHWASGSFFVDMVPAGEITRRGDSPLGPKWIDAETRQRLRDVVAQEQFFRLGRSYGVAVVDGRVREVTIVLGNQRNSVIINDLRQTDKPAAEIRRALRVWYAVLRALSDPGAIQTESQDRFFLGEER
jgi:hypothetical protein